MECSNEIVTQQKHKTTIKLTQRKAQGHSNWLFGQLCVWNRAQQHSTGVVCWNTREFYDNYVKLT